MGKRIVSNIKVKGITYEKLKKYGHECIEIGRKIQREEDCDKYCEIVEPIINKYLRCKDEELRTIALRLLHGYKKFK